VRAAALAIAALAAPAFADVPPPDPRAVQAGDEANLVSNAPRSGVVFAVALGGGLVLGGNGSAAGDTGVGRGEAISFRVGHVATRDTVMTFELTGGSRFHQANVSGAPLLHDDDFNLMAGALVYVAPSIWFRGAGGLSVISFDDTSGLKPHAGVAGLGGVGIDLVRWRQLVLGLEGWGLMSIVAVRGVVFDTGLALGLTYY
jgi:hypothetical protein